MEQQWWRGQLATQVHQALRRKVGSRSPPPPPLGPRGRAVGPPGGGRLAAFSAQRMLALTRTRPAGCRVRGNWVGSSPAGRRGGAGAGQGCRGADRRADRARNGSARSQRIVCARVGHPGRCPATSGTVCENLA